MIILALLACPVDDSDSAVDTEASETDVLDTDAPDTDVAWNGWTGDVDPSAGIALHEAAPGDGGVTSMDLGDLDGDGVLDLAVAMPRAGGSAAGRVWVVRGPIAADVELADVAGVLLGDGPFDELGARIVVPGDLDGDGTDDLVALNSAMPGRLAVVLGPLTGSLPVSSADGLFAATGSNGFGNSYLAGLGDVSGDGLADFALGDPQHGTRVWFGPAVGTGTVDDADLRLLEVGYEAGGDAVSADLDADGQLDLVLSATLSVDSEPHTGLIACYGPLSNGLLDGLACDGSATAATGWQDRLDAGDIDGDGHDDVSVVVNTGPDNAAYVVSGAEFVGDIALEDGLATVVGPDESNAHPTRARVLPDLDGDGARDVALLVPDATGYNFASGVAWIYLAPRGVVTIDAARARVRGTVDIIDLVGGDLTGDGVVDLAVSDPIATGPMLGVGWIVPGL